MDRSFFFITICLVITLERACIADSSATRTKIIESFHVKSDIRFRFATTQMVSVVRNIAEHAQEIAFDVTLPKEAFIVSFSMEIDGKVYEGEVKEKSEAKEEYQAAVERGESAGHVRQAPRHANIFEISVNIASGSAVNFTLTYQEMLRRKLGVYEQEIHINPGQPVEDFIIEMFIHENKPLKFVRTPALRKESLITNDIEDENKLTIVDRPSPETAYVLYEPSLVEQGDGGVSARFVVQYDVEHSAKGDVLVVDGYFIHFFAPAPELSPMPKDIIFVLDVSGSMYGHKMKQLQTAMLAILNDLQPEDRFNIITFSSDVTKWKPSMVDASGQAMRKAKQFVNEMGANGMTNINKALLTAVTEAKGRENKERLAMIFFLTDGVPTVGVEDQEAIAANVLDANGNGATIFGLAFGSGADYESLKTICAQNSGFARKIYEASDAALQVANLYQEISAVALKDISIEYLPSTVDEFTITDNEFPVVFNGSEIVICGRMAPEAEEFGVEIKGRQKSGEVNLVLEIDNMDNIIIDSTESGNDFFTMPRDFAGIVEKMWAYTTIKQMLREKERNRNDEVKTKELDEKILEMSLKYKFVTPLSSMVVTKPDSSDNDKPIESSLQDTDNIVTPPSQMAAHAKAHKMGRRISAGQLGPLAHPLGRGSFANAGVFYDSMQVQSLPMGSGRLGFTTSPILAFPSLGTITHRTTTTTTTTTVPTTFATRNHKSNGQTTSLLTAISALLGNQTRVCLAPRKIKEGTYVLIKSNDTMATIETDCSKKACRTPLIKKVSLVSGNDVTIVLLNEATNQAWKYTSSPTHTVTIYSPYQMSIAARGVEVIIQSIHKRNKNIYKLQLKLDPSQTYRGLIGDFLNLPTRKLTKLKARRVPSKCRQINADYSKSVKNKQAARYKI